MPDSIAGPWEGQWVSNGGHRGQLRCLLEEEAPSSARGNAAKPLAYTARFEAKFAGIFTAHYTTSLIVASTNDSTMLAGQQDLGWLQGGNYHYEAKVSPDRFNATYRSDADEGKFEMTRPGK